jgi:hypothetical protein
MDQRQQAPARKRQLGSGDRDRILQVLSLEYQTLRQDILVRTSGRFQFLGLMTTAAALLATGIFGHSAFGSKTWISIVLAAAVFGFGVACFWLLGHHIMLVSARLAQIEARINNLVPAETDSSAPLLSWESVRQVQGITFLMLGSPTKGS